MAEPIHDKIKRSLQAAEAPYYTLEYILQLNRYLRHNYYTRISVYYRVSMRHIRKFRRSNQLPQGLFCLQNDL